jgi:hypothetical protein
MLSKDKRFWMVWNPGNRAPTVKHKSGPAARKEAERLALQHPGQEFVVLESRGTVRTRRETEYVEHAPPRMSQWALDQARFYGNTVHCGGCQCADVRPKPVEFAAREGEEGRYREGFWDCFLWLRGDATREAADLQATDRPSEEAEAAPRSGKASKLLDDLRQMRDFCHGRHMPGVDCDSVLARVAALLIPLPNLRHRIMTELYEFATAVEGEAFAADVEHHAARIFDLLTDHGTNRETR